MYVKNDIGDYAKIFKENIGLVNGILKQWRSNNIKTLEDLNAYKLSKEQKEIDSMIFKLLMPIASLVDIIVLLIVLGKVEKS